MKITIPKIYDVVRMRRFEALFTSRLLSIKESGILTDQMVRMSKDMLTFDINVYENEIQPLAIISKLIGSKINIDVNMESETVLS